MKVLGVCFFMLLLATQAWAADSEYYSGPRSFISGDLGIFAPGANVLAGTRDNSNTAQVSFTDSGPLAIGVDYDYMDKSDLSFGGFLRYYTVSTSFGNTSVKNSLFTFGPDLRGYLQTSHWIGFFSTGLGYMSFSYNDNVGNLSINSSFGIMLSIGFLYKYSDLISLGFQNMRLYGLTSSISGVPLDDYMFVARFALAK